MNYLLYFTEYQIYMQKGTIIPEEKTGIFSQLLKRNVFLSISRKWRCEQVNCFFSFFFGIYLHDIVKKEKSFLKLRLFSSIIRKKDI